MFTRKFGVEVEFTGITRKQAADTAAAYLNTITPPMRAATMRPMRSVYLTGGSGSSCMTAVSTASVKKNRRLISTDSQYSVEMVTPSCVTGEDIDTLRGWSGA